MTGNFLFELRNTPACLLLSNPKVENLSLCLSLSQTRTGKELHHILHQTYINDLCLNRHMCFKTGMHVSSLRHKQVVGERLVEKGSKTAFGEMNRQTSELHEMKMT